jgi:hypothetical protein
MDWIALIGITGGIIAILGAIISIVKFILSVEENKRNIIGLKEHFIEHNKKNEEDKEKLKDKINEVEKRSSQLFYENSKLSEKISELEKWRYNFKVK